MLDPGETIEIAAVRELQEETGYVGIVDRVSETIPYEPGLTNSCTRLAYVTVDTSRSPEPSRDHSEWSLETVLIDLDDIDNQIQRQFLLFYTFIFYIVECVQRDILIDSRLYSFLMGISVGRGINK